MMFVRFIKQQMGLNVIPEFKFHPVRKWKADYFIPSLKLLIEKEVEIFQTRLLGGNAIGNAR